MKKTTLRSRDSRALDKRRLSRGRNSEWTSRKQWQARHVFDGSTVPANGYLCIAPDVKIGKNVKFSKFINLYGCEVGDETKIGAFVEIQKNAKIGTTVQNIEPYVHL